MTKFDVKTVGNDVWDIRYDGPNELLSIRIEINLRRPARKWYQTKYIYTDFSYCKLDKIPSRVEYLLDTYYQEIEEHEKIAKFFEETY